MQDALIHVISADLAVAYFIVILAGIARGFTGFVAGLVNAALLTFVYGPLEAIAISAVLGLVSSAMLLRKTYDHIKWSETIPLCIAVVVTVPLTAMALLVADASTVKPAIGALIAACGLALILGWRYTGPRNVVASAAVGAVAGGVYGFTGSGGPLMVFYYLASPESVAVQRANIAVTASMMGIILIITLLAGNGISAETFIRAAVLIPGTMIGTWAGTRLFEIASQKIYSMVAQWSLVAIGLALILR